MPRIMTPGFMGSSEGKGGDSFPEGILPNGHVTEGELYFYQCVALGE